MKNTLARLRNVIACTIILIPALAGCSALEEEAPLIAIDDSLLAVPYDNITFPLDEYEMTDDEWRTANHARSILIRDCLLKYGFDVPLPSEVFVKPETLINDRHGLTSEAHAREWGYRQRPPKSRAVPYEMGAPAEAGPVLTGDGATDKSVPEGGCMGEAGRVLSEGFTITTDFSQDLRTEALAKATEDRRVKEKTNDWRACVKKATGQEYATPHDAVRSWNTDTGAHGKPDAKEVEAAMKDVTCTKQTGLAQMWAAVEIAYQNQAIEKNSQQLTELRKYQENWVRNASKVVRGNR
jgi:hypothetical protein